MLNWGPIIYCIVVLPVMIFSKRPGSARALIVTGAVLDGVGTTLRLLPVWFPHIDPGTTVALVHMGQILNAAVGPIVMCLPPKISSTWFADNERCAPTCMAATDAVSVPAWPLTCLRVPLRRAQDDGHGCRCAGQQHGRSCWLLRPVPCDSGGRDAAHSVRTPPPDPTPSHPARQLDLPYCSTGCCELTSATAPSPAGTPSLHSRWLPWSSLWRTSPASHPCPHPLAPPSWRLPVTQSSASPTSPW